jgi:hypothetical protein
MKERELRDIANCEMCGKPFGHTGLPLFWRVTVERFGVDQNAARRQDGLAAIIGSSLAMHMGPDEDIAKPMMDPVKVTLCENCALHGRTPIAALAIK